MELEQIRMELAEVLDGLKKISFEDPTARLYERSGSVLISELKRAVNCCAEKVSELTDLIEELAIALAEHLDVMNRVSKGDLSARIRGYSEVEILATLKRVTNMMIASVQEDSDRRRTAEDALRDSEGKYRTLFDSMPNSIFVLEDDDFHIIDVNAIAVETYGYMKEEFIGRSFLELGNYNYTEGVLGSRERAGSKRSVYAKVQHYRKGGIPFFVNVYVRRSKSRGVIAVTVDITEGLERESQLIQASKMSTLGEMASGVAHELNQPLSTIQMGIDFIGDVFSREVTGTDDLPEVLAHMEEQVDRAVRIINHLRDFGRKTDIKKEKVKINGPIKSVFMLLNRQLAVHNIRVVLDLADDLPPMMGNANRLEQVFINLIMNAKSAMEEKVLTSACRASGNFLTVKTFRERERIVALVSDEGIGIPEEIKEKIFEPFFTTKKVGRGTGLGLSISYGIVKDYDGTIDVESKLGEGTTFRLTFPACEEEGRGGDQRKTEDTGHR